MSRKFLTPIDLSNLELQNFRVQNLSSDPSISSQKGRMYFDSTNNVLKVSLDGSTFATLSTGGGSFTLGSTSISLGSTTTTVGGLTLNASSVWNGSTIGVGYGGTGSTTGSITGTGALTFTAASGNNNVNLVPTGTGSVDVASKKITNLADPTLDTDAATKKYVDDSVQGLNIHDAVVVASTANISGTYTAGSTGADGGTGVGAKFVFTAATIDGYTLVANDRVLLKDQATQTQNGIYVVTTVSSNITLTRASDADNSIAKEVTAGDFVYVSGPASGGTNKGKSFVQTTTGTATGGGVKIGTDIIVYAQFGAAGTVPYATTTTAGIASFNSTSFSVDTAGVVTLATGAAKANGAATKSANTITGNGSTTAFSINHTLGQWVHAQLFDSSGYLVEVDVQNTATGSGTTIFTFTTAPTNGTVYNYVIIG
jgi:hypothetical protein